MNRLDQYEADFIAKIYEGLRSELLQNVTKLNAKKREGAFNSNDEFMVTNLNIKARIMSDRMNALLDKSNTDANYFEPLDMAWILSKLVAYDCKTDHENLVIQSLKMKKII